MADWDAFHAKVVALAPQRHVVEPGHFMVGVLRPDRNPNADQLSQSDFLWIKTRGVCTLVATAVLFRFLSRGPSCRIAVHTLAPEHI